MNYRICIDVDCLLAIYESNIETFFIQTIIRQHPLDIDAKINGSNCQ